MVSGTCLIRGSIMIMNFQGRVLDIANSVNPVISQTINSPVSRNQIWQSIPLATNEVIFIDTIGSSAGDAKYLGYARIGTAGPQFMQAAIGGSTTFTIECINSTTGYMIEVDSGSGFALTAWAAETGSTMTPVTYEAFTGKTEQFWTFVLS